MPTTGILKMNNNYKNIKIFNTEYDECTIKGICSISPTLSAIKSAIFGCLQELGFYIQKNHSFDFKNEDEKNLFIDFFSLLISNNEYKEEELFKYIKTLQHSIVETKTQYQNFCEQQQKSINFYRSEIKLKPNFQLTDLIKQGQKFESRFHKNFSEDQRKGYELVLIVYKSICLYMIELRDLNVDIDKYYMELLYAISKESLGNMQVDEIKKYLKKYAEINNEIMQLAFEERKRAFGEFIETETLTSPIEGKCVLVSGTNLKDLELLLEATKDKGINVYTHGQMIIAHAFPKLKSYSHLVGHYGKGLESYMADFSRFPGPILITKIPLVKIENLYFSSIYTTNKFSSINARQIIDNNFETLIHSAMSAEGFEETLPKTTIKTGVIEDSYYKTIDELAEKIKTKQIKNVFFIGRSNNTQAQIDYFKIFLTIITEDSFLISFYYNNTKNTIFTNLDYAFPFLLKTLDILIPLKNTYGCKINVLNTRCEPHTIPNIITVKSKGVNNIYFERCSPMLMNPALVDFFMEWFDIKKYTNPKGDYKEMTSD